MKIIMIMIILSNCVKNISKLNNKHKGKIEELILAIQENDKDKVIKILNDSINVNQKNEFGNTALVEASYKGHKEIVKLLLEKGADINEKNIGHIFRDYTALMIASREGHIEVVKLLLEKGANVNDKLKHGCTALMMASREGHIEVVKLLLEKGANVNNRGSIHMYYDCTALMLASENGHKEIVKLLIEKEANINDKDENNRTSLMKASQDDHIEVVKLLIEAGANINDKDNKGFTPLLIASHKRCKEVVKLLIEKGANINDKSNDGYTALMEASLSGYTEIVELLLEKGANINDIDNDGFTLLMLASHKGNKEVVELLLEKGANVNGKDNLGNTALMLASYKGHKEIVKLLLEKGANINEKKQKGYTALMLASQNGYLEIIKLLLKEGANINESNINGYTTLMQASFLDNIEVVRLLLEKGANINFRNNKGDTALKIALKKDHRKILRILIENYCQIDENTKLNNIIENIIIYNIKNIKVETCFSFVNNYKNIINFNYRDGEGNTFLHYAAVINNCKLFNFFLNNNIDINSLNNKGETPLYYALSSANIEEDFIWYLINNKAVLKPNSYINDKAIIDALLPYEGICNKLIYEPLAIKLLDNNYTNNKYIIKEIIKVLKIKDNDFEQEKDMINFLKNILATNSSNISISDITIQEEDLEDVDLNINVFKAIFANFTINDYWDEVKANLQYNIDTFMNRLDDIKNAVPVPKPNIKSSAKEKAMYMTFKAKKQLHKLLGYISLTAERGKNNDKIIFAINQILSELVCRGGSLEAIDLAVNTFTGESNNELKHDISILLLNLRKQMLKEAARGRCSVTYFDPMEGRNIKVTVEPEDPHLLIHLCNSFSSELKLPIHIDEHNFNYIYDKNVIMNEYNKIYRVDKIVEYMINQIDPIHNTALWNKVKDYIERNIFKGRPILQIDNFIYDDEYKMKKEAIIALLINFNFFN